MVPQLTFLDAEAAVRMRIRETMEKLIQKEINATLGSGRHERREDRRGYGRAGAGGSWLW